MPAGLQIINTFGTILVDDTSPCLHLRSKQTLVTSTGAAIDLTIPNVDQPLIALRCESHHAFMTKQARNGANLDLKIGAIVRNGFDNGASRQITVYHFDTLTGPLSNYGLQVFNASGDCMFDSSGKVAVVNAQDPPDGIWTGDPGRIYAMGCYTSYFTYSVIKELTRYDFTATVFGGRCYDHYADVNNTTVAVGQAQLSAPYGTVPFTTGRKGCLIIDVTNY